ncbi:MAG: DnaJ family domain-containing protein [Nocardioides sp.]
MPEDPIDRERRLREAAVTKALGQPPPPPEDDDEADEADEEAPDRWEHQALWVDHQIRAAMDRGEFDSLPGAGKPLNLPDRHDPDWWVKGLIEREKITGVLPPALALRREDAELDGELDRMASEDEVRRALADFNARVVAARRQLQGGPPVVTPTREVEDEVNAWRQRRAERRAVVRAAELRAKAEQQPRRRWWRRRR